MRLHLFPSRLTGHLHIASPDCPCLVFPVVLNDTVVFHNRLPEEKT